MDSLRLYFASINNQTSVFTFRSSSYSSPTQRRTQALTLQLLSNTNVLLGLILKAGVVWGRAWAKQVDEASMASPGLFPFRGCTRWVGKLLTLYIWTMKKNPDTAWYCRYWGSSWRLQTRPNQLLWRFWTRVMDQDTLCMTCWEESKMRCQGK